MPTYVTLAEFTQQSIEDIGDSPNLIDTVKEEADSMDGELHDIYLTFGEHDVVMVSEFPDDKSYTQFALSVASQGGLTTETLKAFTEDEFRDVVAGMIDIVPGIHGDE